MLALGILSSEPATPERTASSCPMLIVDAQGDPATARIRGPTGVETQIEGQGDLPCEWSGRVLHSGRDPRATRRVWLSPDRETLIEVGD